MTRAVIRKSRKVRRCEYGCLIKAGELYRSAVVSPNHDGLGNTRWWRLNSCRDCACGQGFPAAGA